MAIARGLDDEEFRRRFFEKYPDFFEPFGADDPTVPRARADFPQIDALERVDRRNPTFRRLLAAGQLLPVEGDRGGPEAPSLEGGLQDFGRRIEFISGLDSVQERFFPQAQELFGETIGGIRDQIGTLKTLRDDLISGKFEAFTTSPEQRQRLIDQITGDAERLFGRSFENILSQSSQRGTLPFSEQAFSGPFGRQLAESRTRNFEDPILRFTRQFDIQEEQSRVGRQRDLRSAGINLSSLVNTSEQQLAGILGQTGIADMTGSRNQLNSLLAALQGGEQQAFAQFADQRNFDFTVDKFEREQSILAEALQAQADRFKSSQSNTFGNFISGGGGPLLMLGLAALTGGASAALIPGGMGFGGGALKGFEFAAGLGGTGGFKDFFGGGGGGNATDVLQGQLVSTVGSRGLRGFDPSLYSSFRQQPFTSTLNFNRTAQPDFFQGGF